MPAPDLIFNGGLIACVLSVPPKALPYFQIQRAKMVLLAAEGLI